MYVKLESKKKKKNVYFRDGKKFRSHFPSMHFLVKIFKVTTVYEVDY